MANESQGFGDPEKLRELFDVSPGLDDGLSGDIDDYLLAHDAMVGSEPTAELSEFVEGVANRLADLSPDELERVVEDARRNSPLAHYMREVLGVMIDEPDTSPVPFHVSSHVNPAGYSQVEWAGLPESAKRLLRRPDNV